MASFSKNGNTWLDAVGPRSLNNVNHLSLLCFFTMLVVTHKQTPHMMRKRKMSYGVLLAHDLKRKEETLSHSSLSIPPKMTLFGPKCVT